MPHTDEACTWSYQPFKFRQHQIPFLICRNSTKRGTLLLTHTLPGDDIGVMVQLRDNHLVTWSQKLTTVSLSHKIDTLRGASDEDDFLTAVGIDKPLHFLPCLLIGVGGTCRQCVGTTMDIRVIVAVIVRNLVYHLHRLLGGCSVVEPDEVMTIHFLLQHRKILLDFIRVQRVGLLIAQFPQYLGFGDTDSESVLLWNGLR